MKRLLIGFTLLMVLAAYLHPVNLDEDLGRHITLGKIILQTHTVPRTNLLSYTNTNFPFLNHHWLSEVIYILLYQHVGAVGILLTVSSIIALCFLGFYILLKQKLHPVAFMSITLLGLISTLQRTQIRPELFSYSLFLLLTGILYKNKENATRLVWFIPLLMVLWVNLHIYFFLGLFTITCFLLGEIWESRHVLLQKKMPQSLKTLSLVSILSFLATFLNPSGIQGVLYPFFIFGNIGYSVNEIQGLIPYQQLLWAAGKTSPSVVVFVCFLIVFALILLVKRKTFSLTDMLLLCFFSILPFFAIRFLGLWYFALAATFSLRASFFIKKHIPFFLENKLYAYTALTVIIGILSYVIISDHGVGIGVSDIDQYGLNFYKNAHIQGPIFNNYDIGSYISFRLYPQEKVFVDERPEAYPASFFQQIYIPMQEKQQIFNQEAQKYHINAVVFRHIDATPWASKFIYNISHDSNWTLVYLDDSVVIYIHNVAKNKDIIQKYGMDREHLSIGYVNTNSAISLLQLGHFFSETGWGEKEALVLQDLLKLDAHNCLYLTRILEIYTKLPDHTIVQPYIDAYQTSCQ